MRVFCLVVAFLAFVSAYDNQSHRQKREVTTTRVSLNSTSGTFTSPGFDAGENYPTSTDIIWRLHVPNDSAYHVAVHVYFMDIEYEPDCDWDHLAYGKNFEQRNCGQKPFSFKLDEVQGYTEIKFHSDFYFTLKGFSANYTMHRLPNKCDKKPCLNNGRCIRMSSKEYECSCTKYYNGRNCEDFRALPCTTYPCLTFEDNFDTLNFKVWEHELTLGGGGNWEFQYYTNNRSNSYVRDGILYLKPTLTDDNFGEGFVRSGTLDIWGHQPATVCTGNAFYGCSRTGSANNVINPIQSARLRSSPGLNIKFGKVEVEAQLPIGDWLWPAIWMIPRWTAYGDWPASGEIDIMESRGNLNYTDENGEPVGVDHVGSTLHYGPNWKINGYMKATAAKRLKTGTFADRFYRYGVEWTEDHIRFTVDDEEILKVTPDEDGFWKYGGFHENGMESPWRHATKMAPFDQEFYIVLNVAVGGMNYFPDSFQSPRRKPWMGADRTAFWNKKDEWYPTWNPDVRNGEDAALKINHVKVWKLEP